MDQHFKITSSDNSLFVDNLKSTCNNCLSSCKTDGNTIQCPIYHEKRRYGIIKTSKSSTFLCCRKTKTTKNFKAKLASLNMAYPEMRIPFKAIVEEEQRKVNRLVHNLTSINAHNIQEIYDLVPQEVLSQNWKRQVEFIKEEMAKDPQKAALTFLRIAKHNTHMKSEFSIYKKLDRDDSISLDKRYHNLRKVLLNILHTFFSDFNKNKVYVEVDDFQFNVFFDYETIQVALYHLIENASKYAMPKSKIIISASESNSRVSLRFIMTSIHVYEDEYENVMKEGVSGELVKALHKQGDGIGLWRINQMMSLNNGDMTTIFGPIKTTRMSVPYSENEFVLNFKTS